MSPRTVERWLLTGCPGGRAGRYDLRAMSRWLAAFRMQRHLASAPASETDADAGGSPALEAKRRIEVELRALDLAERQRQLVHVDTIRRCVEEHAGIIRLAGEQLGRSHGGDAQDVLLAALDDSLVAVRRILDDLADE